MIRVPIHDWQQHERGNLDKFVDVAGYVTGDWLDAVRRERRVLILTGSSLGLERPDADGLDALARDGRLVGITVRVH